MQLKTAVLSPRQKSWKKKQTNKRLISLLRIEMTKQQRKLTFLLKVSFPLPSETQFFSICVSGCMLSYLQTLLLDPCAVWCRNQRVCFCHLPPFHRSTIYFQHQRHDRKPDHKWFCSFYKNVYIPCKNNWLYLYLHIAIWYLYMRKI